LHLTVRWLCLRSFMPQPPNKSQPPLGSRSPSRRILETAKTLVVAYGQSEAARQLHIPLGTVCAWAHRYKWKRVISHSLGQPENQTLQTLPQTTARETHENSNSPANALATALRGHRNRSTLALGQWTAEASEAALQAKDKLAIAKRVRDVASVHSILWPNESVTEILSLGVLTGSVPVRDAAGTGSNAAGNVDMPSTSPPSETLAQWTRNPLASEDKHA
jgi:hypothetical protein